MKEWREWMLSHGLSHQQADWFISKGYDYCKFLYEAHSHISK